MRLTYVAATWAHNDRVRLEVKECRDRIASARSAQLGTTGHDGRPHIVPITFIVADGFIVTAIDHKPKRTRQLRRLRNILENPHVGVLASHYDDDWDQLWWVRADGHAAIHDHDSSPSALLDTYSDALAAKYPQYEQTSPGGPFIEIAVEQWSGWSATHE